MCTCEAPATEARAALSAADTAPEYRKSADMGQILVAVATKISVALAETIILRLVWQMWAAYGQRLRTAAAPAV